MTIYRNGTAIELTAQELREAFDEQQRMNDTADLANYITANREEYEDLTDDELRELLPQFIEEYNYLMGQVWHECAEDAVDIVLDREENKHDMVC
jgi:preprotein translocase subunit SecA